MKIYLGLDYRAAMEHLLSGFLLLLTGLPFLSGYDCPGSPEDVRTHTQQCLITYNNKVTELRRTNMNFYSGLDVEEVRAICSSLFTSIECTQRLKDTCPDTEHTDIEVTFGDLLPTWEMCMSTHFYEVYARNMFCYLRLSASSKRCYDAFQASSDGLMARIYTYADPESLKNLCSNIDNMITCISNHVRANCNDEAANFVPMLVKASIKMSEKCKNETVSTIAPTVKEPMINDDNYIAQQTDNSYSSSSNLLHMGILWTIFISLTLGSSLH